MSVIVKCDCGNDAMEDYTYCEWCEYPEVPIYTTRFGDLHQMETHGFGEYFDIDGEQVYATSELNALMIVQDYKQAWDEYEERIMALWNGEE